MNRSTFEFGGVLGQCQNLLHLMCGQVATDGIFKLLEQDGNALATALAMPD